MKLDVQVSRLPNGLRVATSAMPSVESVAIGVWVGVGGRYETRAMSGVSHFIEHLLFKGTKSRSARDISQTIEGKGGYFNAFTQEESTCYYSRIAAEHGGRVLDILADMYRNPRFAKADIDRERGVIIEEIMMYKDQPHHVVQEMLGEMIWKNHSLGRPLIGTESNILNMKRSDIMSFKDRRYVPETTVIVFAGKVDHAKCVRQVESLLGDIPEKKKTMFKTVTRGTKQEGVRVRGKGIEQTHLAMGIRLFGRHDRRRYALKLLSVVLGENMSSRLFQVVREKHGLAYSVHSSSHLYTDTGMLGISAGVDTRRMGKAVDLIVREVARMKEKPVSLRELRRAKDYAIGQLRIGLESTSNRMIWVGENLISYGKVIEPDEVIRRVEAVTPDDIQAVAARFFRKGKTSAAMVAPEGGENQEELVRSAVSRLG